MNFGPHQHRAPKLAAARFPRAKLTVAPPGAEASRRDQGEVVRTTKASSESESMVKVEVQGEFSVSGVVAEAIGAAGERRILRRRR